MTADSGRLHRRHWGWDEVDRAAGFHGLRDDWQLLGKLLGIDIDDGRADLFDDLGEAVGEGHWGRNTSGLASEELTAACSLPLTLRVRTDPTRIPMESVARRANVVVRRRLRMRSNSVAESVIRCVH